MKTEIPAWIVSGLIVTAVVVITLANKHVPGELYLLGGGAVGVAGGVSIPNSKNTTPNA